MNNQVQKRILVIDDSPATLAYLADELTDEYEVVTVESAEDAKQILNESFTGDAYLSNQFDLIITDLIMPGMNGFEFSQYVRRRNRTNKYTPVILLSNEELSKEEARRSGCITYFSKTEVSKLFSMVRMLLSL